MQQLVSVIIPTYKGADKINSAVDRHTKTLR